VGRARKLVRLFGVALVIVLAALTAGLEYLVHAGRAMDREAQAYADASLQAITGHWDVNEARLRSTQRLRHSVSDDRLESLFTWFASLGPLVSSNGCNGQASMFKSLNGPSIVTAQYVCIATYRDGSATVTLQLLKQNGAWMINGFNVNSDQLSKSQPSERI
jgi:hypothetical protein